MLPPGSGAVDAIEATLKGQTLVPAGSEFSIVRSLPHGHVAAVAAMAHKLGLPALLGPAGRKRDIALALIVSRVVRPKPKLSTLAWWPDTTLGVDLGVAGACTDEVYAAMDWLAGRQHAIERKLAAKHLAPEVNPGRMALFDLTSAWVTGRCCESWPRAATPATARRAASRSSTGCSPTPPAARSAAAAPGNTADPDAFKEIVTVIRDELGIARLACWWAIAA